MVSSYSSPVASVGPRIPTSSQSQQLSNPNGPSSISNSTSPPATTDFRPSNPGSRGGPQGIFWIATVPYANWTPPTELPDGLNWILGQGEVGESGYRHWQFLFALKRKSRLTGAARAARIDGVGYHLELTRSAAANAYVQKEETRIEGSSFQLGTCPINPCRKTDWEAVWENAARGDLEKIPARIRVVSYRTLRAIAADNDVPQDIVRTCKVFWGATGTGKSYRARAEAGVGLYRKNPRTKFWCAYQGQENVVIDEFRGGIDIANLLLWLDQYAITVETKGGSKCLNAKNFWITSNISPRQWYPEADEETMQALLRRMEVIHFSGDHPFN